MRQPPIRILTAVPICDGHDSAISTINMELIRAGIEVIYLGFNRPVRDIVRAAIQEDVRAIGLSSYNGGHVEFFTQVVKELRRQGASDIGVFGGGGGTISHADAKLMQRRGVDRIFFAGTPLIEAVQFVKRKYAKGRITKAPSKVKADRDLAKLLSHPPLAVSRIKRPRSAKPQATRIIGITGPGGVGKTTLIDELVLRYLNSDPQLRIAIVSHDPSLIDKGALLGDRAAMIHAQNDRVFMRSLATRGQAGGLSAQTKSSLQLLRMVNLHGHGPFDVIFVETVGIGQEAAPFPSGLVDLNLLVISGDYGARLQLSKIAMLDLADIVVINKFDLGPARTAASEIEQRLTDNQHGQQWIATTAKRHRDTGVDQLFELLVSAMPASPATQPRPRRHRRRSYGKKE